MGVLDELVDLADQLPPEERAAWQRETLAATAHMKWVPNPGPQTAAFDSEADEVLYGGEPGGGKSDLGLGLAFTSHKRSLILRRQYTDLNFLIERAIQINGSRDGFSGQPPPRLRTTDGRLLDFGAAAKVGDEEHWMGNPHDLIVADEATQFARRQIRFLAGWLRSDDPTQRCRLVLATNPALREEGLWVNEAFAPWIDPTFPNPAKPGELRWYISEADDVDRWVDGPGSYEINVEGGHRMVMAKSRTFIHASMKDNPHYVASGYQKQLDALPESIRSVLLGGFKTTFKDDDRQVIPTAWIKAAQARWKPKPESHIPMCAMGVDCSGGGTDPMVIAPRYDDWFAPLIDVPAKDIPLDKPGAYCAAQIFMHRKDNALVIVDMGGGYGGPLYEHLNGNSVDVHAYKGAEKTPRRTRDKKLGFASVRCAAIWAMREALDPEQPGGATVALPPDPRLVADLAGPRIKEIRGSTIYLEPKTELTARLGRSTNWGDAVVMSWWQGDKKITSALDWAGRKEAEEQRLRPRTHRPAVIMGRENSVLARRA